MGLFSIVCFGGVLATAGYITLAIFDDAFIRLDMKFLTQHTIACLFWGMMYYGWMLWIMAVRVLVLFCHMCWYCFVISN